MKEHFSLESEMSTLGACLLNPSSIEHVDELISQDDFIQPINKAIWGAIKKIYTNGEGVDVLTVTEALEGDVAYEAGGGFAYVAEMARTTHSTKHAVTYAKAVRDKARRRKMQSVLQQIATMNDDSDIGHDELVDKAQDMVSSLIGNSEDAVTEVGGWMQKYLNNFADKADGLIDPMGITTGFTDLDEQTLGFNPDMLWVMPADSGMGKTALAVTMMRAVALVAEQPVVIFQIEMGDYGMMDRIIAGQAGLPLRDIKRPHPGLGDDFWVKFNAAALQISKAPMVIDERPTATPSQMRRAAKRWCAHFKAKGYTKPPVFFVDHAGIVEPDDHRLPREQQVADISKKMKRMAKEFKTSVVLLAQVNRDYAKRQDKRFILSDLRESAALQHNADVILSPYRDAVHNKDTPHKDVIELITAKNRDGELGTVYGSCDMSKSWMGNMTADRLAQIKEDREQAAQQKSSAFGGIL